MSGALSPAPPPQHQGPARRALAAAALSQAREAAAASGPAPPPLCPAPPEEAAAVLGAFAEGGLADGARAEWGSGVHVQRAQPPGELLRPFLALARDAEAGRGRCLIVFHGVSGCAPTPGVIAELVATGLDPGRCRCAVYGKGAYVATTGAKAKMYAANGKWDHRTWEEKHGLPLHVLVLLLALGEGAEVGTMGIEHPGITTDSTAAPTQFCIPRGSERRLLLTHIITIEAPAAPRRRPQTPPPRRRPSTPPPQRPARTPTQSAREPSCGDREGRRAAPCVLPAAAPLSGGGGPGAAQLRRDSSSDGPKAPPCIVAAADGQRRRGRAPQRGRPGAGCPAAQPGGRSTPDAVERPAARAERLQEREQQRRVAIGWQENNAFSILQYQKRQGQQRSAARQLERELMAVQWRYDTNKLLP
eukprot:TRINITY_DN4188_c3_g1_i1.p1 TRINITY_DN4188_c3_g1~~TRINITY_DN4188_c3_g1_i1.p1  ORF type:complete len:490 (+),score=138.65 TRINITY_DN4188_c3_g1_i1:221-1471(+)